MYGYFDDLLLKSKNLFNTSNYYIRQLLTYFDKCLPSSNEKEALNYINGNIDALNAQRLKKYLKKVENGSTKGKFKTFAPVSKEQPLTYELLDVSKHPDYYGLPAQLNQGVMKRVFRNPFGKVFLTIINSHINIMQDLKFLDIARILISLCSS